MKKKMLDVAGAVLFILLISVAGPTLFKEANAGYDIVEPMSYMTDEYPNVIFCPAYQRMADCTAYVNKGLGETVQIVVREGGQVNRYNLPGVVESTCTDGVCRSERDGNITGFSKLDGTWRVKHHLGYYVYIDYGGVQTWKHGWGPHAQEFPAWEVEDFEHPWRSDHTDEGMLARAVGRAGIAVSDVQADEGGTLYLAVNWDDAATSLRIQGGWNRVDTVIERLVPMADPSEVVSCKGTTCQLPSGETAGLNPYHHAFRDSEQAQKAIDQAWREPDVIEDYEYEKTEPVSQYHPPLKIECEDSGDYEQDVCEVTNLNDDRTFSARREILGVYIFSIDPDRAAGCDEEFCYNGEGHIIGLNPDGPWHRSMSPDS